jgi:GR25 family glycosyltransferase involved in LPS biosynthesis
MKSYRLWILIATVIIIILAIRPFTPFIPTVMINLDRSPDRLFFMSTQCDLHGIPFERFSAIDGAKHTFTDEELQMFYGIMSKEPGLTTKYTKQEARQLFIKREAEPIFKKTKNIMACALSHIQIWRKFKNTREPLFILEDDSIFDFQIRQNISECLNTLNALDPEWHIVWVSGGDPGDREIVAHWGLYDIYLMAPPEYIGQGAVGYILSPKGLRHYLTILDAYGCSYASDLFLIEHLDKNHAYGVHQPLLKNYSLFKSSITGAY